MTDSIVATGNKFSDLTKIGSYLFFGSSGAPNAPGRGLYVSQNRGEEWHLLNDSFTVSAAYNITAIAACDSTLFVGTDGAGLWYRPLNEAIISDIAPELNYVARLENNFPNPFNPTTNISFMIPKLNNVRLVVYDILGKEVATLVNSQLQPGNYDIVFDATKLASGIYYYSLITDEFTDTKRMVLVK
jgi:hypothetical protein